MKCEFRAPMPRRLHCAGLKVAIAMLSLACGVVESGHAKEKWPRPTEEARRQTESEKKYDAEIWKRLEPEVLAWTKKGKPYIPWAAKPEDLPQAKIPAFPGAEGGGKFSFGGRAGRVFVVTNLDDSGPGTLREAIESAGPRTVVFNASGIIRLKQPLHIRAPYVTIAGQTAPGDGVCIAGKTTHIDTHDVIIRYMRFRRGETNIFDRDDALGGNPVGNIIVDHCSASWGLDENLSIYRHMYDPGDGKQELKLPTVNVTIQWCISSEALDPYNHAFGGTWGGRNSSFHHNLFACNTGRNPSIGMSYDFNFVNNVLFNWRHRTVDGGDQFSLINCINNYYKPGPKTPPTSIRYCVVRPAATQSKADPTPKFGKVYAAGNFVEGDDKVSASNWAGGVQFRIGGSEEDAKVAGSDSLKALISKVRSDKPFPMAPINTQTAREAYQSVLPEAGATLPRRDEVDRRIVEEVTTGKVTYDPGKGIITDIAQVGGYPEYKGRPFSDVGADGIPLWWKAKYGLDPKDFNLAEKDLMGDGYTVLEKYLNGLDPNRKIDWKDSKSNFNTVTSARLYPPRL
jgi:pectate lyase